MIPSTIAADCEPEQEDEIMFIRGLIFNFFKLRKINVITVLAIHLVVWYNTSEGILREVYWFKSFSLRYSAYLAHIYEIGLGRFIYIFGSFPDGLDPLE